MTHGRAGLPVLTYHAIDPRRAVTSTDPAWFAATLSALLDAGHRPVDLDDWVARGRPDEPRGFALVFDDGLRSILRVADLVTRLKVPATVFLVTGRVGTDNAWPGQPRGVAVEPLLSWSDVRDLDAAGFRFGAHGVTHSRLDGARRVGELSASRATIEDRLGRPCRLLAYPYGVSSPSVRRAAAREFSAGFGTRLDHASGLQDPFDLSRIDAYYLRSRRSLEAFTAHGARGWLRSRRALRAVRSATVSLSPLSPCGRGVGGEGSSGHGLTVDPLTLTLSRKGIGDRTTQAEQRVRPYPASPPPVCPACRGPLDAAADGDLSCGSCPRTFPALAGLPDLRLASDRYLDLAAERAKAGRLHAVETGPGADVRAVATAYYAMTDDVVDHRRERFLRHIAGAEARGEALAERIPAGGTVLEVGCGTGGLVAALARAGRPVVGVDIAARWLVVARRRLADHGLIAPLIAAEAERLPWPDATFDAVAADSVLEHLDDPARALGEWRRVLKPGGTLVVWSPNRFTLTTDPHLGLWGVGWLPRRWVPGYLRLRGRGDWPPRTLSAFQARRLAVRTGLDRVAVEPPGIPTRWASTRPARERLPIRAYAAARRVFGVRTALCAVGPLWELRAEAPSRGRGAA